MIIEREDYISKEELDKCVHYVDQLNEFLKKIRNTDYSLRYSYSMYHSCLLYRDEDKIVAIDRVRFKQGG